MSLSGGVAGRRVGQRLPWCRSAHMEDADYIGGQPKRRAAVSIGGAACEPRH